MPEATIVWRRQARQMTFLRACGLAHPFDGGGPQPPVARVIGYGGAAGGGKSDALLVAGIIGGLTFPGINIGYFRREFPQLEGPGGAIMRSHELLTGIARWNGGLRRWIFPTGAVLQFCHCKAEDDVYNYQSQQFDLILLDEATQFTRFQYRYLLTRNRATKDGVVPFMALATNPGNIGHQWFKAEFIDAGPWEQPVMAEVEPGVFERHIFIPARLSDNAALEERDPTYRITLESQPEIVRKQLLEGDWDSFTGQYYPEFRRDIHVVTPEQVPLQPHWKRFRAMDYGLDCCACYWIAVTGTGQLVVYRELHESELRLSTAAERIRKMTPGDERIIYTAASPDLWNRDKDTGKSGVEVMTAAGLQGLVKADNRRVEGWRILREYLAPYDNEHGSKTANLIFYEHCTNVIKNLPLLLRDKNNPEDVADEPHDITHAPEAIRYAAMSRPPLRSLTPDERRKRELRHRRESRPLVSSITGY
jgi:phage terminase large subunit